MTQLWNVDGDVPATRGEDVGARDIMRLLQSGALQFVVASIRQPLHWIPRRETKTYWENEARLHLAEPDLDGFCLDDFPGGYAYCASHWSTDAGLQIILLEIHH